MTSLERVMAVVDFKKTDRIPVINEIGGATAVLEGKSIKEYVQDGEVLAECQIAAQKFFEYDTVIAFSDLCVEAEAIGCELFFPEDNYPHITTTAINSIKDLDKLSVPDPLQAGRMPELIKSVKKMKERCGGKIPVVAHVLGPLTIASRIIDIEKMLYMIVDEPDDFRRLLSYTQEVAIRFVKCLLDAGADSIIMFNPSTSPAILPEKIFREFELPNIKRIFSFIKNYNNKIITWYSVAGPIQSIIKDLETVDIDIVTIDYLVSLSVAFELSSTLCFNGNIKPLSFTSSNSEEIYDVSRKLINTSIDRGGFILGSGCEVPPNSKFDNIKALTKASVDASKEFTIYGKKSNTKKCITFFPSQKKVYIEKETNLIEMANFADIIIPHLCYKSGACGKCLIQLEANNVPPYTRKEEILLTPEQKEKNYRLACQLETSLDLDVFIPKESRFNYESSVYKKEVSKKSIDLAMKKHLLSPGIDVIALECRKKGDNRSDFEVFQGSIGKDIEILPNYLQRISSHINDKNKIFYSIIDTEKKKLLALGRSNRALGAAVDIGTTTIAIYIYDLKTGKFVDSGSVLNPQHYFGDNVITRSEQYVKEEKSKNKLQDSLLLGINRIIMRITKNAGIDFSQIYKMVIVGNSVMHHMFLGLEINSLVKAPFTPVISSSYSYTNKERVYNTKLLSTNKNGKISFVPLLGGFVGSDITAGILASELYKSKKIVLFIDIGTNGEIVLGNKDKIVVTSVAAGPAFEQFHISGGKIASSNVIYEVDIDENFKVNYKTLNGGKPSGYCGTAVIDIIASLLRLGIVDKKGHFVEKKRCNSLRGGQYILVPKQETAFFEPIAITSRDIQEVQKSKGAIKTGIILLAKKYGITLEQIDKIILTGAFGVTINIENAIRIGMIPNIPKVKVEFMVNAAGIGATMYMLSQEVRKDANELDVEYINVANDPAFNNIFIESMFL